MTPDCPMSPGEQDSPDLICKWVGCGLSFETLDDLVAHLTAAHVTSQHGAFFCFWHGCSRTKGFNARYKMLIHIRTHTNERPYVCSQCEKRFSRQENLRIHARTHTGEKPYVCTVPGCGKAYSNSSDRFKHTRTHFVDKPYECRHPGCGKRYTDPSSLRKHVKIYGHYRRPEDQGVSSSSSSDLLDPSMAASARLDLSPSPSSSGSPLVPSPVPSTPSPSFLPSTLFPGTHSGAGVGVGMGAAGLSSWAPVTAWTVALQQYQAGLLLQGGAGLAGLGGGFHSHSNMVEEEEEDDDDEEEVRMDSSAALDLSMCPSPLDLSLPSSRSKHQ
ncbi:zinc finger protein GLIS2-like [Scylla paramamosain]|uniref:zinc finger protein GLIS2-like n=1 Tax=Scylla paramamosain TaxID=85552 RepID=UPI003082F8C5